MGSPGVPADCQFYSVTNYTGTPSPYAAAADGDSSDGGDGGSSSLGSSAPIPSVTPSQGAPETGLLNVGASPLPTAPAAAIRRWLAAASAATNCAPTGGALADKNFAAAGPASGGIAAGPAPPRDAIDETSPSRWFAAVPALAARIGTPVNSSPSGSPSASAVDTLLGQDGDLLCDQDDVAPEQFWRPIGLKHPLTSLHGGRR